jgi:3-hydroxy-3-methylglutaryl CoA synthase
LAGIAAWGAYIPTFRLDRKTMGKAWDTPALPGERAVSGGDEDSLSMGVEAALAATAGRDLSDLDAVFFATTTSPYAEKQAAATIAAVLDRPTALTADVTGSLRAATTALRQALDAVAAGSARSALVVAADARPAEPATATEQLFGDGAAAVLVSGDGVSTVLSATGNTEDFTGPWRRTTDNYVRSFEAKLETEYGYARSVGAAVKDALSRAGVTTDQVARFVAYAPDPRTFVSTAKKLGFTGEQAKDPLFSTVGNLGAAHALTALCAVLDEARPGEVLVLVGQGDGADAIVIRTADLLGNAKRRPTVADLIASKQVLPSYEGYLRFRKLLPSDASDPRSSTVQYWRDRRQALPFEGVRCTSCGTIQFPANRACVECATLDKMEPVKLSKHGRVFTFTLDHLVGGDYLETPVPRVVVDMNGGGRVFFDMTDVDPSSVRIGMDVELTFRRIHDGAGFHNYYWKARPPRTAAAPAEVS